MNKLALTPEERARLLSSGSITVGSAEQVKQGRPRKPNSFKDDPPVCQSRGCFNYVASKADTHCPSCIAKRPAL